MTTSPALTYYTSDEAARDAYIRKLLCVLAILMAAAHSLWALIYQTSITMGWMDSLEFQGFELYFFLFLLPTSYIAAACGSYFMVRLNRGRLLLKMAIVGLIAGLVLNLFAVFISPLPTTNLTVQILMGNSRADGSSSLQQMCLLTVRCLMMLALPALLWTSLFSPIQSAQAVNWQLKAWLTGIFIVGGVSAVSIAVLAVGVAFQTFFSFATYIVPVASFPSLNPLIQQLVQPTIWIIAAFVSIFVWARVNAARRGLMALCLLASAFITIHALTQLTSLVLQLISDLRSSSYYFLRAHYERSSTFLLLQTMLSLSPPLCTYLFLLRPDIARLFHKKNSSNPHSLSLAPSALPH